MRSIDELAARRTTLCVEGARLRTQLGQEALSLGARLGVVERLARLARSRGVRAAVIGATALIVGRGPRKALKTAWQLQGLWTIAQPLMPFLRRVFRRASA